LGKRRSRIFGKQKRARGKVGGPARGGRRTYSFREAYFPLLAGEEQKSRAEAFK